MTALERFEQWKAAQWLDETSRKELKAIEDEAEITERFYTDLEFGTAGMRGIMGAGTNRMNVYTVRRATQGLASYILACGPEAAKRGVVIAYDSRNNSKLFAAETAKVLCGNGVNAHLYESLRPVPILSFSVREVGAIAGVVITASHNPKLYNGYKVYWEDGAQLPPGPADAVLEAINALEYGDYTLMDLEDAKKRGLLGMLGKETDDKYMKGVMSVRVDPDAIPRAAESLRVVYTALHGSGAVPVKRALTEAGLKHLYIVAEQNAPNGDFPTVKSPNPEENAAFEMAVALAKEKGADLILGTDPDCDRVGVMVRATDGSYRVLTGNMTGTLLLHYILSKKHELGTLPKNAGAVKTIVTTEMAAAVAKRYGCEMVDVLTGFKFIAEVMERWDQNGEHTFQFGFEESYGCLAGTFVRDKDAVIGCLLAVEAAAYYAEKGMTLYDALMALYEEFGYYKETLVSVGLSGKEGIEKIKSAMVTLRAQPPSEIAGIEVAAVRDYLNSVRIEGEKREALTLPKSDVLYFELADGSWAVARPSGTEPKIKFYFAVSADSDDAASGKLEAIKEAFVGMMRALLE